MGVNSSNVWQARKKEVKCAKRESEITEQNEDKNIGGECDKHIGLDKVITVIGPEDKDFVMLEEQRRSDHAHL